MSNGKLIRNPFFMVSAIIALLCFGLAIMVLPMTEERERTIFDNTSVMTVEGVFNRVELVDRHFGDYNGQEVEAVDPAPLFYLVFKQDLRWVPGTIKHGDVLVVHAVFINPIDGGAQGGDT